MQELTGMGLRASMQAYNKLATGIFITEKTNSNWYKQINIKINIKNLSFFLPFVSGSSWGDWIVYVPLYLAVCIEVLSPSEHAAQLQRSEILEECDQGRNRCYTLKSVENVMKKVSISNINDTLHWRDYTVYFTYFATLVLFSYSHPTGDSLCAPSGAGLCAPAASGRDLPHHHLHQPVCTKCS